MRIALLQDPVLQRTEPTTQAKEASTQTRQAEFRDVGDGSLGSKRTLARLRGGITPSHDTKGSMDTFVSLFLVMAHGVMAPRAESE